MVVIKDRKRYITKTDLFCKSCYRQYVFLYTNDAMTKTLTIHNVIANVFVLNDR